jgi:hypothetical protein
MKVQHRELEGDPSEDDINNTTNKGVNSIKPPLLVQNLRNTTTLRLRDKIPPDFARFFAKCAKTQFEAN